MAARPPQAGEPPHRRAFAAALPFQPAYPPSPGPPASCGRLCASLCAFVPGEPAAMPRDWYHGLILWERSCRKERGLAVRTEHRCAHGMDVHRRVRLQPGLRFLVVLSGIEPRARRRRARVRTRRAVRHAAVHDGGVRAAAPRGAPRARRAAGSPARLVLCGAARGGLLRPPARRESRGGRPRAGMRASGAAGRLPSGRLGPCARPRTHRAVGSGGVLGIGARRGGVLRLRGRPGGGRRARPEAFAARQRGRPAPASGGSPRVRPRAGRRRRHAPFGQDRRRHRRVRPGGGLHGDLWLRSRHGHHAHVPRHAVPVRPLLHRRPAAVRRRRRDARRGHRACRGARPARRGPTGWRCCS